MNQRFVIVACGIAISASSLFAQSGGLSAPKCPRANVAQLAAQDACQEAYDFYQFMAPQLGLALSGGNATIGQGGVLGGIGHFSAGVRVNGMRGLLPDVGKFSPSFTGASSKNLPTNDQLIGLPTVDAAIGIFNGLPLALTNIGGIDALVSASYVPTITSGTVKITPNANWQFGYGARLGLLSESIVVPGVSVTWIKRDLPKTDIIGTAGNTTLTIKNTTLKTTAWRVVASKSFIVFGLAAGAGQDMYDQSADISASVSQGAISGTASPTDTKQAMTRTNIFGDISLNLPFLKFVIEGGQASGGKADTYNTFSGGRADRSQFYGSLGLRLSL